MAGENSSQITHLVAQSSNSADAPLPSAVAAEAPPESLVVTLEGDPTPAHREDKTVISQRPPLSELASPPLAPLQNIGQTLIGKTLDHYELIEFVGGGGMGAVFRANDTRLGRTVAVKVLSRDHTDEETIRRFRNEAQSAARLDHPNIARAYFVGESQGWNYIVFEYVEGTNLRDLVADQGPLSLESALRYVLQVAEALDHSSSRDVVHRDVKPSNVLVTAGGEIKLVDMGLARLHQVESSSDDLTASGVTLGTFDYISPEQARDPRAADVRSDLYSLGCTLYYLLAGQPPFPEGTAVQKLLRHSSDEPPDLRLFRPDVPPQVIALLGKLLAKRPSQRHQTPAELIADLVHVGRQLGIASLTHRGQHVFPAPASTDWRTQALQVVLATAALAAAIVFVDAWLTVDADSGFNLRSNLGKPAPRIQTEQLTNAATAAVAPPASPSADIDSEAIATDSSAEAPSENPQPASADGSTVTVGAPPESLPAGSPAIATSSVQETSVAIAPEPQSASVSVEPATVLVSASADEPAIRRLVVSPQTPTLVPPDAEYVAGLAAACRRAAELNISTIELQWNGRLEEAPFAITRSRLVLEAAPGYKPELVFAPALSLTSDHQMIQLPSGSSSSLTIQGLELRLELPAEPSDGWSLIAMGTGHTLELSDCVLTVQDGDALRPAVHDQVSMISVIARRASETMTMGEAQPSMAASTTITLDRCIARGEATIVSMPEETPLVFRWTQGLIVTPRRLLETGGTASAPKWYDELQLNLTNVTASCRQGLYQMKRRSGSSDQFALNVEASNCILMTDADAPLYEYVGPASADKIELQCDGQNNRYLYPEFPFLRCRSMTPGEPPQQFDFKDRGRWSLESGSKPGVRWQQTPDLALPAHSRTTADFLVEDATAANIGFDPALMPEVSAASSAPAVSPAESAPVIVPAE